MPKFKDGFPGISKNDLKKARAGKQERFTTWDNKKKKPRCKGCDGTGIMRTEKWKTIGVPAYCHMCKS